MKRHILMLSAAHIALLIIPAQAQAADILGHMRVTGLLRNLPGRKRRISGQRGE